MQNFDQQRILDGMQRKVPYLGLDLDRMSKFNLLLTYFKCRRFFPDSEVEVEISSSGKGFHIRVVKEMSILENILWRAKLLDDERRLIYSLRKFADNTGLDYFDMLFTEKYGLKTQSLDMEGMLEAHRETADTINTLWGTEEALNLIRELSEKLQMQIERYWTTAIRIRAEDKADVLKTMEDIALKDDSWRWRIFPNYMGHGYLLIVYSADMDRAHKRGVWLINKVGRLKGYKYWVRRI